MRCSPDTQEPTCYAHIIQADLGDPVCSVPEPLTQRISQQMSHAFAFPVHVSYIYNALWFIKCVIALCPKPNVHTLILTHFIAKIC